MTDNIKLTLACCLFIMSIGCGSETSSRCTRHRRILAGMGAKPIGSASEQDIQGYKNIFDRMDSDGDGRLSEEQYLENWRHMNESARRKIFAATDRNKDGIATEAEYVENRIITDEAKAIFEKMDIDGDGKVTLKEFTAKEVFSDFDTNADGYLTIPEYLRVWGNWARE